MADLRAKAVLSKIADLQSRSSYIIDKMSNLSAPLGKGDSVQVGSLADFTISSAVDGSLVPQALSAQAPSMSALTLTADLEPAAAIRIGRMDSLQALDGGYLAANSETALLNLRNSMDSDFALYVLRSMATETTTLNSYHSNVAGDSLVADDIHNAIAIQLAQAGSDFNRLALFLHPYAYASMLSAADFVYNVVPSDSALGPKKIGMFFGVPVYVSQSIPAARTIATTGVSVTSNVATVTCGTAHGLAAGMKVTIAGITTALSTATAITSISSTTVFTIPLTACNGAMADGVGTVTVESCENLLIDTGHAYVANSGLMPNVRIVPESLYTSDILQVSAIWGRVGRLGRASVICSPKSSV